jgi:hypothetical protein
VYCGHDVLWLLEQGQTLVLWEMNVLAVMDVPCVLRKVVMVTMYGAGPQVVPCRDAEPKLAFRGIVLRVVAWELFPELFPVVSLAPLNSFPFLQILYGSLRIASCSFLFPFSLYSSLRSMWFAHCNFMIPRLD